MCTFGCARTAEGTTRGQTRGGRRAGSPCCFIYRPLSKTRKALQLEEFRGRLVSTIFFQDFKPFRSKLTKTFASVSETSVPWGERPPHRGARRSLLPLRSDQAGGSAAPLDRPRGTRILRDRRTDRVLPALQPLPAGPAVPDLSGCQQPGLPAHSGSPARPALPSGRTPQESLLRRPVLCTSTCLSWRVCLGVCPPASACGLGAHAAPFSRI